MRSIRRCKSGGGSPLALSHEFDWSYRSARKLRQARAELAEIVGFAEWCRSPEAGDDEFKTACAPVGMGVLGGSLSCVRIIPLGRHGDVYEGSEEDLITIRGTERFDINAHSLGNASADEDKEGRPVVGLITTPV